MTGPSRFVWHELTTSDLDGAMRFYPPLLGWTLRDQDVGGMRYVLVEVEGMEVAGMMAPPPGMAEMPPTWFGYLGVEDVDGHAARVAEAGGAVHRTPADIPQVGRFAVVADPQGAAFMLFTPLDHDAPTPRPGMEVPGAPAWAELHATDGDAAFDNYAALFGWTRGEAYAMEPAGRYQVIHADGTGIGGVMTDADAPRPYWLYYWTVPGIDAAHAQVEGSGGTVLHGPGEIPGGMFVLVCTDPQGAMFGLVGPRG